ncbi:MAG: DNA-3-methyladenine glycosylase I [Bacteroidales bacterium]
MKQVNRCRWASANPVFFEYHDEEWGVPVHDDRKHFEYMLLDAFQAGLSWLTILRKRENFRKAFDDFDYARIAAYGNEKFDELLNDPGIIRNKLKIKAAVNNAQRFMEVIDEWGSFDKYIWHFTDHQTLVNHFESMDEVPAKTDLSDRISRDLKKRGFSFVGSTIIYAYLQAMGMVNDHTTDCFRHAELT